jgi:hypothetical protein
MDTVRVDFINGRDNAVIGTSDVPLAQLPESFRVSTTLNLAGKQWSVSSATPPDKVDFARTGQLRIVLSEIMHSPPGEILFSLPTISDDCGQATGNVLPHDGHFQIHEDDWRQVEFVAESFREAVAQELNDICAIHNQERVGLAFRRIHIRRRIPQPLSGVSLRMEEVVRFFPKHSDFDAVSFLNARGTIPGSFAWKSTLGPVVWGLADEKGNVAVLCLAIDSDRADQLPDAISKLTQQMRLYLVDWCRAAAIGGNAAEFREYLDEVTE